MNCCRSTAIFDTVFTANYSIHSSDDSVPIFITVSFSLRLFLKYLYFFSFSIHVLLILFGFIWIFVSSSPDFDFWCSWVIACQNCLLKSICVCYDRLSTIEERCLSFSGSQGLWVACGSISAIKKSPPCACSTSDDPVGLGFRPLKLFLLAQKTNQEGGWIGFF